jgi:hypothetical protein
LSWALSSNSWYSLWCSASRWNSRMKLFLCCLTTFQARIKIFWQFQLIWLIRLNGSASSIPYIERSCLYQSLWFWWPWDFMEPQPWSRQTSRPPRTFRLKNTLTSRNWFTRAVSFRTRRRNS